MQALAVLSFFLFYDLFSLYLINSSDMSLIIGKRCIQKCIHNLQCQPRSYHSSAKCKDIGIIVKSCSLCCKTICADCSSDSFKLVCCNGNSDTCSADQDSSCNFSFFLFYFRLFLCFVFVFFRFRRFSLYLQLQVHPKRIDCNAKCFR